MVALVFALIGWVAVQASLEPEADVRVWPIGILMATPAEVPPVQWFGQAYEARHDVGMRIEEEGRGIVCHVVDRRDYEVNAFEFCFTPEAAEVRLSHASDIAFGALLDVGGVCVVVPSESACVLEFEIYAVYGAGDIRSFFGSCHTVAKEAMVERLAHCLDMRRAQAKGMHWTEINGTSRGYLDEAQRRQGLWNVMGDKNPLAAISWRDGIPDGVSVFYAEMAKLRALKNYRGGLLDGQCIEWTHEGAVLSLESFSRGLLDGTRVVFWQDGRKRIERMYVAGKVSAFARTWTNSGAIEEDGDIPALDPKIAWETPGAWLESLHRLRTRASLSNK